MHKMVATVGLVAGLVAACVPVLGQGRPLPTLDALQGAWWSGCQAPAAEFVIEGTKYSGDFDGEYELQLVDDILTLHDGLPDGHSIDVTHRPLSFQVVEWSRGRLLLRPLAKNAHVGAWELRWCDDPVPSLSK